ncbi:type VI secretion system lipoprotein TssJ [Orrella sp. JC864]|uniref:type VI secretion system lipoprotein TssJ n=1 Tax=Orrella sp. JC864 TaxID=3120298 RepID=UPI0012BCFFA6
MAVPRPLTPVQRLALGAVLLLAALLAAGCASTAKRVGVPYEVRLIASDDVNPDARQRPSPVQITVYTLRSTRGFEQSDFFALQGDPRQLLGEELIAVEQVILRPGQVHELRGAGDPQAQALGVVAAYRDLEHSDWRLTIPLPEARSTNIYKFWQMSPSAHVLRVVAARQGISAAEEDSPWWRF